MVVGGGHGREGMWQAERGMYRVESDAYEHGH